MALRFGEHGLPLMGTGDWNDGMNMVGIKGRGESIWLGFFLYDVLMQFSKLATPSWRSSFAERCQKEAGVTTAKYRTAWLGWRVVSACLL